ncbi:MAG: amidohydrolase [Oscillospiraceae bacterium]|nr:amidohydrolase [Oscillospiraceae bacterium]
MKQLLKHADILIRNGNGWTTLKNAYLGIDGDTICSISEQRPLDTFDYEKDLSGKLLIPGLINCHCHSPMVFLRGIGSDLNLQDWLFHYIFPTEAKWTDAGIRSASYLAILEMLACGVTSFSDMYYRCDNTIEALCEAGMKANICRSTQGRPDLPFSKNTDCKEGMALFDTYQNYNGGKIKIDFCIHAEYTNTPETIEAYSAACFERGARMHIHLSETKTEHQACIEKYGMTATALFAKLGTLRNPTTAAHCVWVSEEDMDILKAYDASPVHCPSSNMKIGSGFAPIQRMLDKGLNVTIGTDGAASNNNLNMLEEIHLASVIHNGYTNDPTIVKPSDLLKMATMNGAKLQGRDDTGELKVGKKADIVAIDFDKPHLIPAMDYPAMLTYSVQGSDVCMTMIDGKILYENGEFKTLDADKIRAEARHRLQELYR